VRGGRYGDPTQHARSRVGGIVHDESATRSTVFVEPPEIIELGQRAARRRIGRAARVLRVLRRVDDLLRPHRASMRRRGRCASRSTICVARARYAVEVNGFVPEIGGTVKVRSGRHPLIRSCCALQLDLAP